MDEFQDLFHCCGKRRILPYEPQRKLAIRFPANMIKYLTQHAQLWSAVRQDDICRPDNVYATSISHHTAGGLGFRKCSVSTLLVHNLQQSEVASSRQHCSKTVVSKSATTFDSGATIRTSMSFSGAGLDYRELSGLIPTFNPASSKDSSIACQRQN